MTGLFRAFSAGLMSLAISFTGSAEVLDYFNTSDETSTEVVDHSAWTELLQTYIHVDANNLNRFDYDGVTEDHKADLEDYLDYLSGIEVTTLNKTEQRAYWINAYNAITVNVVLDEWPLESIRDIDKILFVRAYGPWFRDIFEVEDQVLTLDAIEHKILRPIWQDPRTHYAVNCASIGCPNLQDVAFTSDNMEELLNKGAYAFINSERGIQKFDGKSIRVSSIYSWFKEDFGETDANIIAHLKTYAQGDVAKKLENVTRISGHDYNWNINKVAQ